MRERHEVNKQIFQSILLSPLDSFALRLDTSSLLILCKGVQLVFAGMLLFISAIHQIAGLKAVPLVKMMWSLFGRVLAAAADTPLAECCSQQVRDELFAYLLFFFIIFTAFALFAHVQFGPDDLVFSTFWKTMAFQLGGLPTSPLGVTFWLFRSALWRHRLPNASQGSELVLISSVIAVLLRLHLFCAVLYNDHLLALFCYNAICQHCFVTVTLVSAVLCAGKPVLWSNLLLLILGHNDTDPHEHVSPAK